VTRCLAIAVIVIAVPLGAAAAPSEREIQCIAQAVYHEARGEPFEGQRAVAHIVINRAAVPKFPASICGVVYQRGQFSSLRHRPPVVDRAAWAVALTVARLALEDRDGDPSRGATYFDHAGGRPPWLHAVVLIVVIGDHAFYREASP
jgi:N-acetylmuramoyl-L-alanine amidase